MATDSSKNQNQLFLAQLERQRLQKPCQRIIDLRGKVPGECQPYEFGGLTHYLDDRNYLILKQLVERMGGLYTVGVYEALLQTVRQFQQQSQQPQLSTSDDSSLLLIRLDQPVRRQAQRVLLTLPVTIQNGDLNYHAMTLDVSADAIRVSMKQVSTLEKNDTVNVSFQHFPNTHNAEPTQIAFDITRLDHDEQRTFIVMRFNDSVSDDIRQAWQNWLSNQTQRSPAELNNEILNLTQHCLLRLYSRQIPSLLCWIGEQQQKTIVTAVHRSTVCDQIFTSAPNLLKNIKILLSRIEQMHLSSGILALHNDRLLVISADELNRLKQYWPWPAKTKLWQFKLTDLKVDETHYHPHLDSIAQVDPRLADDFSRKLSRLKNLLEITDITACVQQLNDKETTFETDTGIERSAANYELPPLSSIKTFIRRQQSRYTVVTPVALFINGQEYVTQTNEVSVNGLSLSIDADLLVSVGSRATLHFTRWQNQRPLLNLRSVPYEVKRVQKFAEQTELGLQRMVSQCPLALNQFFEQAISTNQHSLARREDDLLQMQYSRVYLDLLSHTPLNTALFFGLDNQQKRVLQAVAGHSQTIDQTDNKLWQAISNATSRITLPLKTLNTDNLVTQSMGLYCYRSQQQPWQIICEHELQSKEAKSLLLHRLFNADHHFVFHCQLVNSKTDWLHDEQDLTQQINALRSHSAHRIKNLRQMLSSIFSMGYLTDITNIVRDSLMPADRS